MEVRAHMEMNMGKFSEKLVELLELAKKKKNVLEYQEINDFFKDQPLGVEQMEKVFDFLEASGVDVLRITDGNVDDMILDDDDADIDKLDEEEIELDKIDLSVPEGVSIEDPVRMYLKESVKFRFFPQKKKSNLPREWSREMRLPRNVWQKQTFVWLSALPRDMWDVECFSLT